MPSADHEPFLRRAIELSAKAALEFRSGGAFGAVIVRDGRIIAEGMNRVVASHDPTWHAEMEAIRLACAGVAQDFKLPGCILYSSAEPCPMCAAAAYWAGIERIYYASTSQDARDFGGFDDSRIYHELALPGPQRSRPAEPVPSMREEALEVWKAYRDLPGKVPY
jgi:tRNA(Arg) A34 adenosine deaminase TadA